MEGLVRIKRPNTEKFSYFRLLMMFEGPHCFHVGNFYFAKKILVDSALEAIRPAQTQADSIGVRRGIVPPARLHYL